MPQNSEGWQPASPHQSPIAARLVGGGQRMQFSRSSSASVREGREVWRVGCFLVIMTIISFAKIKGRCLCLGCRSFSWTGTVFPPAKLLICRYFPFGKSCQGSRSRRRFDTLGVISPALQDFCLEARRVPGKAATGFALLGYVSLATLANFAKASAHPLVPIAEKKSRSGA